MVSPTLLTFCVGLTCSIMESEVDYKIVAASNSVHVLTKQLRGARIRLNGFSEWLSAKTESNTWDMLGGLDESVNPPLREIRNIVNEGIAQGKEAEHCYTEAYTSAKAKAKRHLALVIPCIQTFKKATEATLIDIPDRLREISNLEHDLSLILPDCEKWTDKATCIEKRLSKVSSSILGIESFTRTTVEKGNGDYLAHHATAIKCVTEHLQNLDKEMSVITSEANICVRKS